MTGGAEVKRRTAGCVRVRDGLADLPRMLRTSFQSSGAGPTLPSVPAPVRRTRGPCTGNGGARERRTAKGGAGQQVGGGTRTTRGAPVPTTPVVSSGRSRAQGRADARAEACQRILTPGSSYGLCRRRARFLNHRRRRFVEEVNLRKDTNEEPSRARTRAPAHGLGAHG